MKAVPRPSLWFWFFVAFVIHGLVIVPFLIVRYLAAARPVSGGDGVEIVGIGDSAFVVGSGQESPNVQRQVAIRRAIPSASMGTGQDSGDTQDQQLGNTSGEGVGSGPGSGTESGENQVLAEIRQKIERAKHYPQFARSQGVEGTTEVSFQLRSDGSLLLCQLVKSSGSLLLDHEAVETVKRASPYPFYPKTLRVKIDFSSH